MHFLPVDAIASEVAKVYAQQREILRSLIPHAQMEHIGSTAIPGSITKGDIDILVTVEAAQLAEADRMLAERFARNEGSGRSATFSSFKDEKEPFPLGIQLVARGSDDEWEFRTVQARLADPDALDAYNALKLSYEGKGASEYITAKDTFIRDILEAAKH